MIRAYGRDSDFCFKTSTEAGPSFGKKLQPPALSSADANKVIPPNRKPNMNFAPLHLFD
ncbi:protein of unknown function [Methylocella tundrae]|uniref:Uncharacterized protein n=1 Tax=Methylocella tundrae TaxID=227605 RepID=A0A4U8YUX8_METTU|nr:protein of unknown function [Methylocella tundrae]